MDSFTPTVTDCAEFTGTGTGVASGTGEAGQNGGGSVRPQHIAAVSIVIATISGIVLIN